MNDRTIDIRVHIKRPLTDVFAAWSSAESLARWFAPMATENLRVTMDFNEGGAYSIVMPLPDGSVHTTQGIFKEIVANRKIVMTWHCDAFEDAESIVHVEFTEASDGTDIHLVHEVFESSSTCDAHRGGWDACLAELSRLLETASKEAP